MAVFPKIQSPCPYRDRLGGIMDGDVCRMCHRQVFDLTQMDGPERLAFLRSCEGEVCISYLAPARIALAAMALAASVATPLAAAACEPTMVEVVVGGLRNAAQAELIRDAGETAIPALPVIYEPQPPARTPSDSAPEAKAPAPAPVSSKGGS
jgi:hypothetical protein